MRAGLDSADRAIGIHPNQAEAFAQRARLLGPQARMAEDPKGRSELEKQAARATATAEQLNPLVR